MAKDEYQNAHSRLVDKIAPLCKDAGMTAFVLVSMFEDTGGQGLHTFDGGYGPDEVQQKRGDLYNWLAGLYGMRPFSEELVRIFLSEEGQGFLEIRGLPDDPGTFGVIISDLVYALSRSYMDHEKTDSFEPYKERILELLHEELENPTSELTVRNRMDDPKNP